MWNCAKVALSASILLSGCAQSIAQQKDQALQLVQQQAGTPSIMARHPGEAWHVLRDDEYNVLLEGRKLNYDSSVFCPEDFRVFYGTVDSDPDEAVYLWFVDVADDTTSQHAVTWAAAKVKQAELERQFGSEPPSPDPNDPPIFCADGKPQRHSILDGQ